MEQISKETVLEELQGLCFHDSCFRSIELHFSDTSDARSCRLNINYYDWEGNAARKNQTPNAQWEWKSLVIDFGYVAVFEYSAPDLSNSADAIDDVEFGNRVEELKCKEEALLKEFSGYCSPLFNDKVEPVSIKFLMQNGDENSEGYILVIGSEVKISWGSFPARVGQVHFPLKTE